MPDTAEASVKVFISSVIAGMEEYRAAAREAAENLGYTVIAAEDFGASPSSPQQVCLEGVRKEGLRFDSVRGLHEIAGQS